MSFKPGDTVRLKGDRRTWTLLHTYPDGMAMVEIRGESWGRCPKLAPAADLTLITDLEDF